MTAAATLVRASGDDPSVAKKGTALQVENLAKSFGATQALRSASLELRAGEVHALVGENGSGKSTFVKVLSGVHRPDAGSLSLAGSTIRAFRTPSRALRAGIATVFQEVHVVPPRSVLENIWLGVDGLFRNGAPAEVKRDRARTVISELMAEPPPLDTPVEALSLSERQACCIARALVRGPQVLILDEATSALDVETRDRLFKILRALAARGGSVIFISHRMDEIAAIGDRCTVMRSGETVATLERGEASASELVRLMAGAEHLAPESARARAASAEPGDVVLTAKDVVLRPGAAPIEVKISAGELVGLAGLEGQGQDAFLRALWGAGPGTGQVVAVSDRGDQELVSPRVAAACGIAYVPRERYAESLFESKSVRENFALPTLDRDVHLGLLSLKSSRRRLSEYVDQLSIKLGRPDDLITTLSGGNQQKVILARWLATDPRVLLLNDPTRGVDIGTKRDLYRLLAGLASQGVAIVMLSTELDEHVELMDRVLVFRDHQICAEVMRGELSRRALVEAFFGETNA